MKITCWILLSDKPATRRDSNSRGSRGSASSLSSICFRRLAVKSRNYSTTEIMADHVALTADSAEAMPHSEAGR